MTEVTRIACPGCRSLLRFEPEALDFPADCGGCDCRFSVGVYVKIACPNCHSGSKIRERYLSQRVRCVRCSHPFIASEGIPQGGGGRLLVARMLETDSPTPPETIQPFLGHAREEYDRRTGAVPTPQAASQSPVPPTVPLPLPAAQVAPPRSPELDRQKTEALAERDRLVQEAGLYKAILAKLVTNPAGDVDASVDPTIHETLATLGVSMAPGLPGASKVQSEVALWRATEEKNRLEDKVKKLQAEVESKTASPAASSTAIEEINRLETIVKKLRADLDAANLEIRKHRTLVTEREQLLLKANEERQVAVQKHLSLATELDRARAEADENRNRLSSEMTPALQAAEEARQRHQELEAKIRDLAQAHEEAKRHEARLIAEHTLALEEAERQKTALSITVDRLTQAVISARSGEYEALDRLEEYASGLVEADAAMHAELNAERQRGIELDQIVKELQSDIETIRLENLANSKVRDAEMNELRRKFAEERKILQAEIDKSHQEKADAIRRIEEITARSKDEVDAAQLMAEEWRSAVEETQTQNSAEVARLEASLAKREQLRSSLADENKRLTDANEKLYAENARLQAQVAEAGSSADSSQTPPNKKLAQAIEQNQMLHLDNVRLGNLIESAKIEADRRQKNLVLEVQRIKSEYEKLVSANEKLVERVQELLADKMAMAESLHANGSKSANSAGSASPAPIPSALDLDQAVTLANRSKEVELHRDIAFSMLYGDTMVEKRTGKNGS